MYCRLSILLLSLSATEPEFKAADKRKETLNCTKDLIHRHRDYERAVNISQPSFLAVFWLVFDQFVLFNVQVLRIYI